MNANLNGSCGGRARMTNGMRMNATIIAPTTNHSSRRERLINSIWSEDDLPDALAFLEQPMPLCSLRHRKLFPDDGFDIARPHQL